MKLVRNWKVVLAASAALELVGSFAHADTVAKGPYYAVPSWDQKLRCDAPSTCPRFQILGNWDSEAVLDRETGLVWETVPSTANVTWNFAVGECSGLYKGGRMGWRLPTIQEIGSLIDRAGASPFTPALPTGHPFTVEQTLYWSATTYVSSATATKVMDVGTGVGGSGYSKSARARMWCVRGGSGLEAQ